MTATPDAAPPRLELEGIAKRFGDVVANEDIALDVRAGEIHALLGENGAGKSTLVKIVFGLLQADAGEMRWQGRPVRIANPSAARALGIGIVMQHFALFESLTVAENVALGLDAPPPMRELNQRIAEISERYGLRLDPGRHVQALSVGERQRVEIVRCLIQDPTLLIMDEPTSVLTPQEVEALFAVLRRLRAEGRSVLYISHKLEEIRALCDRATVLRGGRVVSTCVPAEESNASLAAMMLGEGKLVPDRPPHAREATPRLELRDLSLPSADPFGTALQHISLAVHGGEVVGIAGVAGNGQAELAAVLSGEVLAPSAGAVFLEGQEVGRLGPAARRKRGLAFVPEERLGRGAVPDLPLTGNGLLSGYATQPLVKHGLIDRLGTRRFAQAVIERFGVRAGGPAASARSLSGGNLQRFIIGRELLQQPRVLICVQPTWGIDALAATAVQEALLQLAADGAAVLVISQDLDELMAIADRIAVIGAGRLSVAEPVAELSVEQIGLRMGGRDAA
ncbi:MAG: ABC transporter ATP-binding protein [Alphaproteobacteria bacterium]